jgi:hypothetical protein
MYAARIYRRLRGGSSTETLSEANFEDSDIAAAVARLKWALEDHDPENEFGVLFNGNGVRLAKVEAGILDD